MGSGSWWMGDGGRILEILSLRQMMGGDGWVGGDGGLVMGGW